MTRALILALWSHWRRKPGQFFSVMAGLALATALWSAVQAINDQARRSYDAAAAVLAPPEQTHVVPTAGHRLTLADYATLRRAGWQVTPVQETRTRIGETFATVLGVDLFGYPLLPTGLTEGTDAPGPVDLIQAPGVAFAHPETAQRIGLVATGLRIHSSEALPTGIVLADLAISRTLVAQPDDLNRLLLLENQPVDRPPLASIAPHLRTELSQAQAVNGTERLTESFHLNLTAFGLLSFTVGLFIVQSTIALAFEQRRPLVRNLRSMGVPRSTLTRALVLEVVVLALCAGAVGLVLGYMIAGALLPGVSATLRGLYGADVAGSLTLRPIWILSGLAMSVAGALIAALGAILRLHHIPILPPGRGPR
ncbi:MAG: FtsX-like permease family protein [Pseudomonadota bacterium]